jgi:hypothetical protein
MASPPAHRLSLSQEATFNVSESIGNLGLYNSWIVCLSIEEARKIWTVDDRYWKKETERSASAHSVTAPAATDDAHTRTSLPHVLCPDSETCCSSYLATYPIGHSIEAWRRHVISVRGSGFICLLRRRNCGLARVSAGVENVFEQLRS